VLSLDRRAYASPAEAVFVLLEQFNRSIEWAQWAQMGTNDEIGDLAAVEASVPGKEKAPH